LNLDQDAVCHEKLFKLYFLVPPVKCTNVITDHGRYLLNYFHFTFQQSSYNSTWHTAKIAKCGTKVRQTAEVKPRINFLFMFCWPASWYNRVKKTNLMHNLVYFVSLYMFRAYLGPSSGGTTVCIQQLVLIILFRWLSLVLIGL